MPDRLTAVLEELEAVRRAPGWVPAEQDVIDQPRSRVAQLPRRVAATARRPTAAEDAGTPDETRVEARGARHAARGASEELHPRRPLLRPPEPLLGAQVAPSRLAVIGAVVLVAIAALVFGGRVLLARTAATPRPVTATGSAAPPASASASGRASRSTEPGAAGFAASPGPQASSAASVLVVQVVGQVRRPGVVQVRAGSRVQDAVEAAGGALPGADLAAINLARQVSDGEQIQVPKPGEQVTPPPVTGGGSGGTGAGAAGGAPGAASAPAIVDLNTADLAALDTLPGVGPVLAQRIVQWRTDNGRFTSVEELGEVSGIGDKLLAQLTPLVRVG